MQTVYTYKNGCIIYYVPLCIGGSKASAGQYFLYFPATRAISRLTVVSREAKKKRHARASSGLRDHYSELFTRMAALKF